MRKHPAYYKPHRKGGNFTDTFKKTKENPLRAKRNSRNAILSTKTKKLLRERAAKKNSTKTNK